ncbi:MAG: nucleotide sugar dehydrogenase, partial [Candidatus Bathyarchaeia archaeon]
MSFFGLGYVGIVYSVGFASKGFRVVGFDVDEERARLLSSGFCPIYEPHVEKLLRGSLAEGQLRVTADPEEAVSASDVSFITVGTPSRADGSIDLRHVISASEMVGRALRRKDGWHLVAVKSTVIPGTTGGAVRKAVEAASGRSAPRDFGLAVNPEFLREGNAVADFLKPDRIIIGACDSRSRQMLESLYSSFNCPKIVTGLSTAELIKYVNNAFLAMKVSFINMIAGLCQRVPGIDVKT